MVTSADYPDGPPPSAAPPYRSPLSLLTIAGHDPSNGAGITADLQVFAAHRFFGLSAPTALTVQSTLGVAGFSPVNPDLLGQILHHLLDDIVPAGVKIGMVGSVAALKATTEFLQQALSKANGKQNIPSVFDPVLISSSGRELLPPEALSSLHDQLLPAVTWITPNWSELSRLTHGKPIHTLAEAESATHHLAQRHPHLHIVATAGDAAQPTDILRLPSGELHHFQGQHIESRNTHGTGCAFSSALLCNLVQGQSPVVAVQSAKHYVTEAILRAPNIGHGKGPLNLLWPFTQLPGGPILPAHHRSSVAAPIPAAGRVGYRALRRANDCRQKLNSHSRELRRPTCYSDEAMSLTLIINGHPRTFADLTEPTPLSTLVTRLELKSDRVAIEHNGEIAPRTTWPDLMCHHNDRLEIVHFVGGGSQPS